MANQMIEAFIQHIFVDTVGHADDFFCDAFLW